MDRKYLHRTAVILIALVLGGGGSAASAAPSEPDTYSPQLLNAMRDDLGLDTGQARLRLQQEATARQVSQSLRESVDAADLAGTWFDSNTGQLVATVTSKDAAERVRSAGARAEIVPHSAAELAAITTALDQQAPNSVPDGVLGWYVDVPSNTVVVRVLRGTDHAIVEGLLARAGVDAGSVRVIESEQPSRQQSAVRGGDEWTPGQESPCSIGFSATGQGGSKHFITAGHCTDDEGQPASGPDGQPIGKSAGSNNNMEGDYGKVDVTESDWELTPSVASDSGAVTLKGSDEAEVGQSICRSGRTSGWKCGEVTAKDQTQDFGDVVVGGLTLTTACSESGDSGGSFVSGEQAQGTLSGGTGCNSSEPESSFQPVNESLQEFGLTLVTE